MHFPLRLWFPIGARERYEYLLANSAAPGFNAIAAAEGKTAAQVNAEWVTLKAKYGANVDTGAASAKQRAFWVFWGRRAGIVVAVALAVVAWRRGWIRKLRRAI